MFDAMEEIWLADPSDVAEARRVIEGAGQGLVDQAQSPLVTVQEFRSSWGRPSAPVATPKAAAS
jgi:hypothetical protein